MSYDFGGTGSSSAAGSSGHHQQLPNGCISDGSSSAGGADGGHRGSHQHQGHAAHRDHDRFAPAYVARSFDVMLWYPAYQSCVQYFVDVSQKLYPVQALAAFVNIRLPYQRPPPPKPVTGPGSASMAVPMNPDTLGPYGWVSLHPYIRRLVATGFDKPEILLGWFGEKWQEGVGPLHEQERRNYLFAAKSGGWEKVKRDYDVVCDEAVPFLQQLGRVDDGEIEGAEEVWSKWLAMEDWMLGSRALDDDELDDHMGHH